MLFLRHSGELAVVAGLRRICCCCGVPENWLLLQDFGENAVLSDLRKTSSFRPWENMLFLRHSGVLAVLAGPRRICRCFRPPKNGSFQPSGEYAVVADLRRIYNCCRLPDNQLLLAAADLQKILCPSKALENRLLLTFRGSFVVICFRVGYLFKPADNPLSCKPGRDLFLLHICR
jgi:hypothetical protein